LFTKKRRWMWLGLCIVLAGCASAPSQKSIEAADKPRKYNPVPLLLRQAEDYLARDRLMSPASGNAYDRFRAVLLIHPEHPQAVSGLQQILIRYMELGREALRKEDIARARRMLVAARKIDSHNALLAEFEQELRQAIEVAQKGRVVAARESEFLLNGDELAARSDSVQQVLRNVAQGLQGSDKSVLIVARSDAEGRWLYKALRQAANGQRIRGDIKIDTVPRIVLLPPIY